ncbi:MAG: hypothetical protein V1699_04525 [Candidatus Omnitrophota bacterium]
MKKIILFILVLSIIPAIIFAQEEAEAFGEQQKAKSQKYMQQQREEQVAFLKTLEGKKSKDIVAVMVPYFEAQYQDLRKFNIQRQQQGLAFAKNQLATNSELTDAQKVDIIKRVAINFQEELLLNDQQYNEDVLFRNEIAKNPNMTQGQKLAAIKARGEERRARSNERSQQRIAGIKAGREKIYSGVKTKE